MYLVAARGIMHSEYEEIFEPALRRLQTRVDVVTREIQSSVEEASHWVMMARFCQSFTCVSTGFATKLGKQIVQVK